MSELRSVYNTERRNYEAIRANVMQVENGKKKRRLPNKQVLALIDKVFMLGFRAGMQYERGESFCHTTIDHKQI